MKLKALVLIAGLALTTSLVSVPATASETVQVTEITASTPEPITAPSDVVLTSEEPAVSTEPAPQPEPVPAPVQEPEPTLEPVAPAPVDAPVAPVEPAPVVPATEPVEPVTEPTEPVTEPTAPVVCQEDDPCWDCAVMGNVICGTTEALELFTTRITSDAALFNSVYLGLYPTGTERSFNTVSVPSDINAAYEYHFIVESFNCIDYTPDTKLGVSLHCYDVKGIPDVPIYLGADTTVHACATYSFPSVLHKNVIHSFMTATTVCE